MKKVGFRGKIIIIVACVSIMLAGITTMSSAETDLEKLYREKKEIEAKLDSLKNQKKNIDSKISSEQNQQYSLDNQIKYLDNVINDLKRNIEEKELDIEKKQKEVEILEAEISGLSNKIDTYEKEIEGLNELVRKRLNSSYKQSYDDQLLETLFSRKDEDVSVYEILKYYKSLREKDKAHIEELRDQKHKINEERKSQEEKKIEAEKIAFAIEEEKNSLISEQQSLGAQVVWKEKMIESSKQNQRNLEVQKKVLSQEEMDIAKKLQETQNAIFAAMNKVDAKIARHVKKGEIIGKEGCSGMCTGDHLHFFVDANGDGINENPCNYLPSGVISGCGTSNPSIDWPMKGTFYLTSWYGWRNLYGYSSFHSAIDIAYPWGTSSDFIYAAHDGYVTYGKQSCAGAWICNGGYANYAILCSDVNCSMKTGYWHLE